MEQLERAGDPLQEHLRGVLRGLIRGPGDPAHFGDRREAIVHLGDVAIRFPRVAPRPVDAEAAFARRVRPRNFDLVVGAWTGLRSHMCPSGEKPQCLDAGKKEVGPATNRGERRKAPKPFADRPLGNRHVERAILRADDRVPLVVEILELRIVDPDVHRELELADQARAADERGDASLDAVVRRALRQRAARRCRRGGSSFGAACSRRCRAGSCAGCARRSGSDSRAGPLPCRENRWCAADRRPAPDRPCPERARAARRCASVPSASPPAVPAAPASPIVDAGSRGRRRRAPPCAGTRGSCHCARGPPAAAAAAALRLRRRTRGRTRRPSPAVQSRASAARRFPRSRVETGGRDSRNARARRRRTAAALRGSGPRGP